MVTPQTRTISDSIQMQPIPVPPDNSAFLPKSPIDHIPVIAPSVQPPTPKRTLERTERDELLRRFAKMREPVFSIADHHPILREYYQIVSEYIDAKPQIIVTPLLSSMAANVGNHAFAYVFGRKIYCNVWTIIIGPSSIARKSTSMEATVKPLYDFDDELEKTYLAGMEEFQKGHIEHEPAERHMILPDSSPEELISILAVNPNGLILNEEIAAWLAKMEKSYAGDLKPEMVKWFDGIAKSKRKTRSIRAVVRNPAFSVAMGSTKDWLVKQLRPEDLQTGFMQRFLLCDAGEIDRQSINCRLQSGKTSALRAHNYLAALYNGLRQIGLDQPVEVEFSREAIDLHERLNGEVLDQIFEEYNSALFSYWARLFTGYFVRLCILFTLAEYVDRCIKWQDDATFIGTNIKPEDLIVSEKTAAWVLKLCHYYFHSIRLFLAHETTAKNSEHERKIVEVFYKYQDEAGPERKLSRSFLMLQTGFRRAIEFDEALKRLMEFGVIQVYQAPKPKTSTVKQGRPKTEYQLILDADRLP